MVYLVGELGVLPQGANDCYAFCVDPVDVGAFVHAVQTISQQVLVCDQLVDEARIVFDIWNDEDTNPCNNTTIERILISKASLISKVTSEECSAPPPGGHPLARVGSFVGHGETGGVRLLWYTLSEKNTASFEVRRSSALEGPFTPISGAIPAAGTDSSGTAYEFLDPGGSPGDCYRLMETETGGRRGPCAAVIIADEPPATITPVGLQVTSGVNPNYGVGSANIGPPYDAMIICPAPLFNPTEWADSLLALRDHWVGFRHHPTLLVTTETTGTTKEAIRDYILSHSGIRYVLLVGDQMPFWYVHDDALGGLATDHPYGDVDGDSLADIAIGRWPAASPIEAVICAGKSIDYDYQNPAQPYRLGWTGFTNDDPDIDVSSALTRALGDNLLALTPAGSHVVGAQYRASDPCCRTEATREAQTINAVNAGTHLVWALGTEASPHDMCHFLNNARYMGRCDPDGFYYQPFDLNRFEANGACSFWFMLSCHLAAPEAGWDRYDCLRQIYIRSIAKDLLMIPNRGPLTWFGPTNVSYQNENYLLGREVLTRLGNNTNLLSVGQVCIDAAKALALARPTARVRAASYMFLGDPTIVMAWSWPGTPTDANEGACTLTVGGNPAHGDFRFQFAVMHPTDVTLSIYDVAGRRVRVLTKGMFRAGTYREQWNGRDEKGQAVAAGIYLVHLRTLDRVLTQKLVMMR